MSTFGSWLPSEDCRPHECVCSPHGVSSGETLVSLEIEVKPTVHGRGGGLKVFSGMGKRRLSRASEQWGVARDG